MVKAGGIETPNGAGAYEEDMDGLLRPEGNQKILIR
jgi:hypothetical protein